jgi:hypothetical protein
LGWIWQLRPTGKEGLTDVLDGPIPLRFQQPKMGMWVSAARIVARDEGKKPDTKFLVVGLLAFLIFTLFVPLKPPKGRDETLDQLDELAHQKRLEKMTSITLRAVFGVVFCFFIWAVIANYVLG